MYGFAVSSRRLCLGNGGLRSLALRRGSFGSLALLPKKEVTRKVQHKEDG